MFNQSTVVISETHTVMHMMVYSVPVYCGIAVTGLAQVVLPILWYRHLLYGDHFAEIESWTCPQKHQGNLDLQLAMFVIACIYVSRLSIRAANFVDDWWETLKESFWPSKKPERPRLQLDSMLGCLFVCDAFHINFWRCGIYMLNLWSILIDGDTVQDLISNCLAAEFLVSMDVEFAEAYFKVFEFRKDALGNFLAEMNKVKLEQLKKDSDLGDNHASCCNLLCCNTCVLMMVLF